MLYIQVADQMRKCSPSFHTPPNLPGLFTPNPWIQVSVCLLVSFLQILASVQGNCSWALTRPQKWTTQHSSQFSVRVFTKEAMRDLFILLVLLSVQTTKVSPERFDFYFSPLGCWFCGICVFFLGKCSPVNVKAQKIGNHKYPSWNFFCCVHVKTCYVFH